MKAGSIVANVKNTIDAQPQSSFACVKEANNDKDNDMDDGTSNAYPWWNDFPELRDYANSH